MIINQNSSPHLGRNLVNSYIIFCLQDFNTIPQVHLRFVFSPKMLLVSKGGGGPVESRDRDDVTGLEAELKEPTGQAQNSIHKLHARFLPVSHYYRRWVSPELRQATQALANVGLWAISHELEGKLENSLSPDKQGDNVSWLCSGIRLVLIHEKLTIFLGYIKNINNNWYVINPDE